MTKNIFLAVGLAESGKTQTIRALYKALLQKDPPRDKDFDEIVSHANIKIGFCSAGDTMDCLKPIKKFREANCDLLICACRTRGDTLDYFRDLQSDYILHPILTFHEKDLRYRLVNNARVFDEFAAKFAHIYKIALQTTNTASNQEAT